MIKTTDKRLEIIREENDYQIEALISTLNSIELTLENNDLEPEVRKSLLKNRRYINSAIDHLHRVADLIDDGLDERVSDIVDENLDLYDDISDEECIESVTRIFTCIGIL